MKHSRAHESKADKNGLALMHTCGFACEQGPLALLHLPGAEAIGVVSNDEVKTELKKKGMQFNEKVVETVNEAENEKKLT
jgi:hypothetical protein